MTVYLASLFAIFSCYVILHVIKYRRRAKKGVSMESSQQRKLGRYLKNSQKFLWGLSKRNQKNSYDWLDEKGYDFSRGTSADVTSQPLEKPGIEALLRDLIIPRVTEELFSEAGLSYFRACWQAGTTPDLSLLRSYNILDGSPFIEVNTQFNYVERWGEFAGPWFEEIEDRELTGENV